MNDNILNKILIEWDNSTVEDTGIIKSSDVKSNIEWKSVPINFFNKLIKYNNIISKILESKKLGGGYNFLNWLEVPWMLTIYDWQGDRYNDESVYDDYLLDIKDIFCDWATTSNGGLLDKEGWDGPPSFSFVVWIDCADTECYLYKHYKKFEKFLAKNFNNDSLEIDDHPEKNIDELYFFTIQMETNNPKGNETIIRKWFNDTLEVCELYVKFIQSL